MIYKIKMNKEDYFKVNSKIISANLEINGDDVYFEVEGGSYNILKRSNYKFKLLESVQNKILRFLSRYALVIVGVLFLFSILYMNMFRVSNITFNRSTPINDEIEATISSSFRKLFYFDFCNLDYGKLSRSLRVKYPQYPYIDVRFDHNTIKVSIYNYDEVSYTSANDVSGDIIAKKDGVVDIFYVYNGQNMVAKNKYVKDGEVLISGLVQDKTYQASGLIMATTYEKVVLEIPKTESSTILTSEKDEYYQVKLFNFSFDISKDSDYVLYERTESTSFNLFDFFTVKKIAETKKNDIIITYTYEDALQAAKQKIKTDFLNHQVNQLEQILAMEVLKCEETEESFTFTLITKKYESIGVFQSY